MGAPLDMPRIIVKENLETKEAKAYQRLIMSINAGILKIGCLSDAYRKFLSDKGFGSNLNNYGYCITGTGTANRTVWGSGNGKVVEAGWDVNLGYVAVVHYDACQQYDNSRPGFPHSITHYNGVIMRYFHMGSVKVSKGQRITKDTIIGTIGSTGKQNLFDYDRVFIELDTDIDYPTWSPYLLNFNLGAGDKIKKGISSTFLQPWAILHKKESAPDNQTFVGSIDNNYNGVQWYYSGEVSGIKKYEA